MGKLGIRTVTLWLICWLPVTTLIQRVVPHANKLLFFVVIAFLALSALVTRYTKRQIVLGIAFLTVYCCAFLMTSGVADNVNEYAYLLLFILLALCVTQHRGEVAQFLKDYRGYLLMIVRLWCALALLSIPFPSAWSDGYFYSFSGNVFRSATASVFVMALVAVLITWRRIYAVYALVPLFCILNGGSRTYLALGAMIAFLILYLACSSKRVFYAILIPALTLFAIALVYSSVMGKIMDTVVVPKDVYYKDPLVRFTSGRSLFWKEDLRSFFQGPFYKQIVGYGYNFVYDVNEVAINNRIWAHNDFIGILLCYGYVGLACYIGAFAFMYKACIGGVKLPKWVHFILIFIWCFNAFFNMFYTYVCASASYPFLLLAISGAWGQRLHKAAETNAISVKTDSGQTDAGATI